MTATCSIATATASDAAAVADVRNAAAVELTRLHGQGHWSGLTTAQGVLHGINTSRVLVARFDDRIVGTLRLTLKRPWAIDPSFFADSRKPLYLVDMAVTPSAQRQGTGRELLRAAVKTAEGWKADAIRLDAYDHAAGAGPFYEKCGFEAVGRAIYRGVPLIYYQFLL